MKYKLLIGLLFFCNYSFGQWKVTTPVGISINDITFTDRYTGYAVFQAVGTGSCMTTLSLYKTIDEGNSWIRMNTGTTNAINAIHFVNDLTGWIAGNSSEIRKTTDGGVTWTQQNFGVGSGYNDIWFKDLNNGFVIGNNGLLRKSVNGGATWQTISSGVSTTLRKIFFYDNNLGFIACGNGQILRTSNGGTNWTAITTGAIVLNDIYFTSAQTGYAVGAYSLYITQNGGLSWTLSSLNSTAPLTRLFFPSSQVGFIVADGEGILKTLDAGNSWSLTTTMNGSNDSWKGIYFIDEQTGYICGSTGRINKTINGGTDWLNMTTGFGLELFSVSAPHKDTAYIGSYAGKIYKTSNAGINFKQQCRAFPSQITKVFFQNPQLGFASSDSGRILKTTDGGNNWHLIPTNTSRTITDFSFVGLNHGYASASGGIVFKTIDNGETWDSISTGIPNDYRGIWFTNSDTGYVISNFQIVHTFNGGLSWTVDTAEYASSLNDIVFTNDSLGYCAGSFGKFLYTQDAGLTWDTCNAGNSNAEINEMWPANDSTLYLTRYGSQSITMDSCKTVSSMSTACLANNWSMNSISMTNGGTYGYAVGGLNGVVHQLEIPEIIRTIISVNSYCPGSTIYVEYYAKGFYNTGNVFTAQLSDAAGSFTSPIDIGTYTTLHMVYQSGIITATLPSNLSAGNYRIRVISSNPAIIGPDNGFDIGIQPTLIPSVSIQSEAPGACAGEYITFTAQAFAGGLNPAFQWIINGTPVPNNGSNILITNTLQNGDSIQVIMESSLNCADPITTESNFYIAAISNSPVFNLGNDTAVCTGSSIQLNAPSGYIYNWTPSIGLDDPHSANPIAIITSTISYQLSLTDTFGCSQCDTIEIMAYPLPPQFNLGNDTAVCVNSTVQITAPAGYIYHWSPTAGLNDTTITNPVATITSSINYQLQISDSNACYQYDTISIIALPLPSIPVIYIFGDALATSPAAYFQWYLDGVEIPGAIDSVCMPSVSGQYTVKVTNEFGCSNISLPFTVTLEGLQLISSIKDFKIYPNPISFVFHIDLVSNIDGEFLLEIYNLLGQQIYTEKRWTSKDKGTISIDLSALSNGSYVLKLTTQTHSSTHKIIKR